MELSEKLSETPLAELSVKEFFALMDTYRNTDDSVSEHLFEEDTWLSGYKALAKYLNCSVPTVCRLVKSGRIAPAIRRVGATYWFDKSMICNLLKSKSLSKTDE